MQFDTGNLRRAVDGNEQAEFTLTSSDFRDVDMKISNRVSLGLLLRFVASNIGQAADPIPLQTAM